MKTNPKISIRKANFSDIEFLWYLRNRPDVYKCFKKSRPVSWKEHIGWILPIILGISPRTVFIIQKTGIPIGQVRFDYQTLDISISILREFRGKDIASKALNLEIKRIREEKRVKKIIAEINKNNPSSLKLFEKAGFKFKTEKGNWLKYSLDL